MNNKPCPFCGTELRQENRLNVCAKKYSGDSAFLTYYVHPNNGCIMSGEAFRGEKLEKWNRRIKQ